MSQIWEINLKETEVEALKYLLNEQFKALSPSKERFECLSLETALYELEKEERKHVVCRINPEHHLVSDYPLEFLGYSIDDRKKTIFHIYTPDEPRFAPSEDTQVSATYRFTIPEPFLCKLLINWDSPLKLLAEPGKYCKSCTVFAQGGIGQNNILDTFYKDLELIETLKKSGKAFSSKTSCVERVKRFIEIELKVAQGFEETETLGEANRIREEKVAAITGLMPRSSLDFTDKLWEVLKYARNFEEMKGMYLEVLCCIRERNLKPKVFDQNNTILGYNLQRYRKLSTEDSLLFNNLGLLSICEGLADNIVEICIEIGINKLKSDFQHFLLTGKVCFSHQIDYLVQDNFKDINLSILKVQKLYKIMQVALLLKTAGLKVATVHQMIGPLIDYYVSHDGFKLLTHKIDENFELPNLVQYRLETWEAVKREKFEDYDQTERCLWIDGKWHVFLEQIFSLD